MKMPRLYKKRSKVSPRRRSLKVSSHAKLNLFLDVINKRSDGYHNILTLFERISLKDEILLSKSSSGDIKVTSDSRDIPDNCDNLAYKAADLIKKSCGVESGVNIYIKKNIPVGAGLAGGSSNAASVLLGMNNLFDLRLKKEKLLKFANKIGSDVAFFILNTSFAVGRGRGNLLKPVSMQKKPKIWHLLFVPALKIMTKDVYRLWDNEKKWQKKAKKGKKSLKLTSKRYDVNILLSYLKKRDIFLLNQNIYNRLGITTMKSYRLVSALKTDLLKLGLNNVHMSGSGPTLFTVFKSKSEALSALRSVRNRISDRVSVFMASTL